MGAIDARRSTGHAVLVVDDDANIRALVSEILEDAGYTAFEAASGEEALVAAETSRPTLVIVDVHFPGMSGYETCRRLRERFGDDLAIMILSGSRTEAYDRVAGFEFGADDYLLKPFAPEELLARVRALLRRTHRNANPLAAISNSTLTPRELEVLELLAAGLDQREIAQRLVVAEKTVGKHIENVLRKLAVHSRAEAVAAAYRDHLITGA